LSEFERNRSETSGFRGGQGEKPLRKRTRLLFQSEFRDWSAKSSAGEHAGSYSEADERDEETGCCCQFSRFGSSRKSKGRLPVLAVNGDDSAEDSHDRVKQQRGTAEASKGVDRHHFSLFSSSSLTFAPSRHPDELKIPSRDAK
jgi:hypothetical protein